MFYPHAGASRVLFKPKPYVSRPSQPFATGSGTQIFRPAGVEIQKTVTGRSELLDAAINGAEHTSNRRARLWDNTSQTYSANPVCSWPLAFAFGAFLKVSSTAATFDGRSMALPSINSFTVRSCRRGYFCWFIL